MAEALRSEGTDENSEIPESVEKQEESEAQYPFEGGIIVFGHGYAKKGARGGGWQLSPEAKMRVIGAYQLWKDGLAPKIILTGGAPSDADKEKYGEDLLPNSEQMAQMLRERFNVPDDAIYTEASSVNTIENIAHALTALQEQGVKCDDFVTVSTGYHMDRITEIMNKFNLKSQPISAEEALNRRAEEHADMMRERDVASALDSQEIEKRYEIRKGRYDRAIHGIYRTNEVIQKEFAAEGKWLNAMKEVPGFWIPQTLAVQGDKLKEIVSIYRPVIEEWLERHPDMEVTIEDLIEGNFDYKELTRKGRELPTN